MLDFLILCKSSPHFFLFSTFTCLLWGARVAQWWERLPPTNVARVQILASMPYVGWVCCLFSPLLQEVFLRVLWFYPSPQKPTFSNSNSTRNQVDLEPLCRCATCKSLFIYLFIFILLSWQGSGRLGGQGVGCCGMLQAQLWNWNYS